VSPTESAPPVKDPTEDLLKAWELEKEAIKK
jgi:hypothetical protein